MIFFYLAIVFRSQLRLAHSPTECLKLKKIELWMQLKMSLSAAWKLLTPTISYVHSLQLFQSVHITSHQCKETGSHTVFENHRKSLIQHCERSELRLHFGEQKLIKNAKKLEEKVMWHFGWFSNTVVTCLSRHRRNMTIMEHNICSLFPFVYCKCSSSVREKIVLRPLYAPPSTHFCQYYRGMCKQKQFFKLINCEKRYTSVNF